MYDRRQLSPRNEDDEDEERDTWLEQGMESDWEGGIVMLVKQMYRDPSIETKGSVS